MKKVPDFVAFHGRFRAGALACIDLPSGRRWDYRAFDGVVNRAVTVLEDELELRPGDRLAVLGRNSADFVILHLACMRMGAIFVPLNWRCSPVEIAAMLTDCDPAVLVADEALPASLMRPVRVMRTSDAARAIADAVPKAVTAPFDAERPAVLLYTSGTTGEPKGAILSAHNLFFSALNFGALGSVDHRSVFLCEAPMFHVIGLVASLHSPMVSGGTMLISDGFEAGRTIGFMADRDLGATHYFCVPQMAARIRSHADFSPDKLAGLLAVFTGGAPHPASAIHGWLDLGIAVVDGYGMTETGTLLGMPIDPSVIRAKAGSCGIAAPHVEIRILNDGRQTGENQPGELWVKGPNVTSGYWNRQAETAANFSADGWFRTGDIAAIDADGFVTIVGRNKDMYISGGENIYAGEVEIRLLQHPAIAEAAVIGLPDEKWGEVGYAYIVAQKDTRLPTDQELAEFCSAALARYKVPQKFFWRPELPRTASGKVSKRLLRK